MLAHPALLREPHLTDIDAALWAGAAALLVTAGVAEAVARTGPVDRPDVARASHAAPTATSGGLAAIAGAGAGLLLWRALTPEPTGSGLVGLMLGLAALSGAVGAVDDVLDIGARLKLGLSVVLALAASAAAPVAALPLGLADLPLPWIVGVMGGALWLVTAVNAVNFMDGANGVATGGMAIALAALSLAAVAGGAPAIGAAALAGAAASAGLLPANLGGRLFQGDAGALFTGALFAGLCLAASAAGAVFLYFGPLALLPFLTDVLLTLLRRARGRRPLLDAHREHLYQRRLAHLGGDHDALAREVWATMAAAGAAALALSFASPPWQAAGFGVAVVACAASWAWLSRKTAGA